MLCAAAAAAAVDALPRRTRNDLPGAIPTRGAGERRSLRPRRKANVTSAATAKEPTAPTSTSSSSQYLDALQSLLREAREDGMPAAEGDGTKTAAAATAAAGGGGEEGEEEAPWSLGDSAVFLSAALDGGGGGDESVSVEEARELLLKTVWRRSRGGGRYQTREKARARTDAAAAEFEGARGDEAVATTAVPSPSSLSATLSALREHAGLAVAKGTGGAPPPPSYPPSPASSSLARAVRRCPSLLALSPNQVALAAAFLRSLGLDASDVAAACAREPRLLGFGVAESMAPVASFLRSGRVGMRAEDVARLAVSAPTVLGLSVARSLEPRVALLERALSCPPSSAPSPSSPSPSSSSGAGSPPTAATNPLLAKVLRSSPSLLHLSLGSGEETLAELERRLPDARVRSRAIAAAPSTLLVGAERVSATLDALARVASPGLNGDDGGGEEEDGGGGGGGEEAEERLRRLASDLVRRHPALLRHAFTGPDAVLMPAADWLARLLSVETGTETAAAEAAETAETETAAARPAESESPPPLLLGLPPSSTPRGRALAAAAIRRCPALLGRSRSGLEGTASWLQERARAFLLSSAPSSESDASDSSSSDAAFALGRENRGRTRSPKSANRTPLSLVAGVARRFPQAFGLARANLDAKLAFLTSEVGMSGGEAAGVAVSGMPQLLGLRLRSLRARAAFLLDGNDEVGIEEEEKEEAQGEGGEKGDGERSGSEEEAPRPAPAVAEEGGAEAKEKQRKPIRGRRSASEIARFAPCLATSLEKLVARHAAAGERRAAAPKKKTKKKTKEGEEDGSEEKTTTTAKKKKRMPSLSSLLACTDAVLEGRLGLPAGSLEALKADRRVREAIESAEGAAVGKEEVEV